MIDDGGPAFPNPGTYYLDGKIPKELRASVPGMTLLDWFAGQALPTVLRGAPPQGEITAERTMLIAAGISYQFAAAMIEARNKLMEPKS